MLMTKQTNFNVVNGVDKPPIHNSYDLWHLKKKKMRKKNITLDPRQKDRLYEKWNSFIWTAEKDIKTAWLIIAVMYTT